jgi:hypothetical protein
MLTLSEGTTYSGSIALLNHIDPKNGVHITAEVRKEANFHRFFYSFTRSGVNVPTSSLDLDTQSPAQPVGINCVSVGLMLSFICWLRCKSSDRAVRTVRRAPPSPTCERQRASVPPFRTVYNAAFSRI